jgi:uncharacterized protein YrrD
MRSFNDIRGNPVMTTSSAEQVGEVMHFVVEEQRVQSLHVDGGKKDGQLISWSAIVGLGEDAVVVKDAQVVREPENEREARAVRGELAMVGKRALDDVGDELGEVSDVMFDPDDGTIVSVMVDGEAISGKRLRGVGSYAVIVRALDDA